jgi:two-component system OmpR family sensor kinase
MRQGRRQLPWYWRLSPAVIGLIGLGFSVLFSGLLAWYLARPIRALRRGFDQVAAGDLDTRVSNRIGPRRDELADLGSHFDTTIARLQQLIQSQRQLLHDVSHELRSPLARIQAAIGLMQQNPDKTGEMIQRVERESVRLDNLVGEILTLSRMGDGNTPGQLEPFDLDDMLADIAADARLEATGRAINISVSGTAGELTGRSELIQRAIENLVRNAVKFTNNNSAVEVRAERSDDQVVVTVRDQGPGVPEEELSTMTEPFVRGGTRTSNTDGYGLGLAIARRAIEIHRGSLSFENLPTGGLLVTVALPLVNHTDRPEPTP